MTLARRDVLRLAASAAALPLLPGLARAQAYPSRPITMVVPFPAGGPTDVIARTIAERMRNSLGQTAYSGHIKALISLFRMDCYITLKIAHFELGDINQHQPINTVIEIRITAEIDELHAASFT